MKPLIVYASYSGITRRLAEDIALMTDGEMRELKPQKPYSFSYHTAVKEARWECKNSIIKEGIALKGDYSFEELKTWLDRHV